MLLQVCGNLEIVGPGSPRGPWVLQIEEGRHEVGDRGHTREATSSHCQLLRRGKAYLQCGRSFKETLHTKFPARSSERGLLVPGLELLADGFHHDGK